MPDNIYIIGEIGQAHEGSIGMAHALIDAVAGSGINAIKFQVHIAEAESSPHDCFRTEIQYADATRTAYWKRMEFTKTQWSELRRHCEHCGLDFIASPFSVAAVDLLKEVGVSRFKVGSGETENYLMLHQIGQLGKEIIVSTGLSNFRELDETIAFLQKYECPLSILQCTTSYPTQPFQWGLNVILDLKKRYALPVGFSDHSGDIFACLAAASLGARLLEFHITFDRRMFGFDTSSSVTADEVFKLVKGVRAIEQALQNPMDKSAHQDSRLLKAQFGKSLAVKRPLKKGDVITLEDLESKKPAGYGIESKRFVEVLGRKLARDIEQWDFVTDNHF